MQQELNAEILDGQKASDFSKVGHNHYSKHYTKEQANDLLDKEINELVGFHPQVLNTIMKIANSLRKDPEFSEAMQNEQDKKR